MSDVITYLGPCMESGCRRPHTFSGYCPFHTRYLGRNTEPPVNRVAVDGRVWYRDSDDPAYQARQPPRASARTRRERTKP